jgi:hypothetical protein
MAGIQTQDESSQTKREKKGDILEKHDTRVNTGVSTREYQVESAKC